MPGRHISFQPPRECNFTCAQGHNETMCDKSQPLPRIWKGSLEVGHQSDERCEIHESHINDSDGDTVLRVFGLTDGGSRTDSPSHQPSPASRSSLSRPLHESGTPMRKKSQPLVAKSCMAGQRREQRPDSHINDAQSESSGGVEICFGDPLFSDDQSPLQRITQLDRFCSFSGCNSDIYRAKLIRSDGPLTLVAIKLFRIPKASETDSFIQRLNLKASIWRKLRHRNILPSLGLYEIGAPLPILLSPFFTFGHVGVYLKNHPSAPRQQLMHGVAFGLEYLHRNKVVHGDLKVYFQSNILIDKHGVPCICDFGISQILNHAGFGNGSTRYAAPELFSDLNMDEEIPQVRPAAPETTASDVYAFACVALEILAGKPPVEKIGTPVVTREWVHSRRPNRADSLGCVSHDLWLLFDQCCRVDSQLRPTMTEILESPAFGVTQRRESFVVPKLTLTPVSDRDCDGNEIGFGDPFFHSFGVGRHLGRSIVQQDRAPLPTGRYGCISRGYLDLADGQRFQVVIKTLKPKSNSDSTHGQELIRRLTREAHVWMKLSHSNVLPFLGLYDIGTDIPILLSPFCKSQNVGEYLKHQPDANKTRWYESLHDAAAGVKYLHDLDIVHGNLVTENVLVDKRGVPCIVDFGLFKIFDACDVPIPETTGHMAPEVSVPLEPVQGPITEYKTFAPTKMSDMYSFALVAVEILTAQRPSRRLSSAIGQAPEKNLLGRTPAHHGVDVISLSMWTVLVQCWNRHPELRPTIDEILESPPFWALLDEPGATDASISTGDASLSHYTASLMDMFPTL
ncbi:kinase-like domain-containing protein [Mycena alexandri]|uniref:Kinase-like domain-containing protein n=1 Tax=Mycena alexandri TaxID=1745969 RepID=A0AAD6SJY4_9AGAR|nr:kinase-like domain-containing protein [Mycena alexandri]